MSSIAVIIPTYDRPKLLLKAIQGVKSQSYKVNEIFVVDTNPSHKNQKIVKSINNKLNLKIKYLKYKGKKSAHYARNVAVKKSKSKFLAFLDDDDHWKKNYLQSSYNRIIKSKSDICISEYNVVDTNGRIKFVFNIPKIIKIKNLFIWNPGVICSNILIKKKTFISIGGYDHNLVGSADKDLLIKIILNNFKYIVLKKRLVNYLVHTNQWSQNKFLTLESNLGFYKKYKDKMNWITKIRIFKKIIKLKLKILFK